MEYLEDDEVDAGQQDLDMEDGWPITDIIEELDDDDNVLSYRLISADDSINRVQAALEKAGVTKQDGTTSTTTTTATKTTTGKLAQNTSSTDSVKPASSEPGKPVARGVGSTAPVQPARKSDSRTTTTDNPGPAPKKTVSFSEDVATQQLEEESQQLEEESQQLEEESQQLEERSFRARRVEHIMNTAKEQEKLSQEAPIIPEDEDPDDAALRQQMLRYGMGEIGAVVAELQLEEGGEDDSELDYDEGFDEEEDEDDEDMEDEYGRNGRVVTDKYRQRMLELEKKLGIESRSSQAQQVGTEKDEDSSDDEGIGRIVVKRETEGSSAGQIGESSKSRAAAAAAAAAAKAKVEADGGKKSVRFAPSLDIAPETESVGPAIVAQKDINKDKEAEKKTFVDPLSDIVERSPSSNATSRQPSKKASRFKSARGDAGTTSAAIPKGPMDVPAHFADQDRPLAPSGPKGTTIANTLVEREPASAPVPPDEFDGSIAYQEVADEYQKMRRRFIQREGGFLRQDESPVQPVIDEDNQEPMSRFKAARLSRQ